MQKKSLLVALFCGALCLTGCLKNEESASVVQVRNAKANELNSIAKLNEAKAAAEAVYAEAELTLAKAEAELKKAEANLVNAQAETEKVRAELLKVQVELAEVLVEEEKVKLQLMEANLESRLIALEVEMAAAEAAKQGWINVLNNLKAQADIDAIENEMAIVALSQQMDSLILTVEGAKADSAKVYADLYFKTLNEVAVAQAELIAAKATRVLIEREAMDVREAIYNEIDKRNEQIAQNEAYIAELKTYQDMDVEEAKAKLEESRIELNKAYNDYQDAIAVREKANTACDDLKNMVADFNNNDRKNPNGSQWYQDFKQYISPEFGPLYKDVYDVEITYGDGLGAPTKKGLKVEGLRLPVGEDGEYEFVPFWHSQDSIVISSRYPNISVVSQGKNKNYVELNTTLFAPATIYYENVEKALDITTALYELELGLAVADFEEDLNEKVNGYDHDVVREGKTVTEHVDGWKETKAKNEDKIALHKKYLKAREDKVAAAEAAYVKELGKAKDAKDAKDQAWKEFQEYILVYNDESREVFRTRYAADTTYQGAVRDTVAPSLALDAVIAALPTMEDITPIFEEFVAAEGAYNGAKYAAENTEKGRALGNAFKAASDRYNPEFQAAIEAGLKADTRSSKEGGYYKGEGEDRAKWFIPAGISPTEEEIPAGSVQDSIETWNANIEIEKEKLYVAQQNKIRFPGETALLPGVDTAVTAHNAYITARQNELTKAQTGIQAKRTQAMNNYKSTLDAFNIYVYGAEGAKTPEEAAQKAQANRAAIEAAYNPKFNNNNITDIVTFPTPGYPEAKFGLSRNFDRNYKLNEDGEWVKLNGFNRGAVAGTAQGALISAVVEAVTIVEQATVNGYRHGHRTALKKYLDAIRRFETAKANLLDANKAFMIDRGAKWPTDPDVDDAEYVKEHLAEYLDPKADELYQAYKDVTNEAKVAEALEDLKDAYRYAPDEIGELEMGNYGHKSRPYDNLPRGGVEKSNFGWLISSYEVDYEATMVDPETGETILIADYLYPTGDKAKEVTVKAKYTEPNSINTYGKFTADVKVKYLDENGKVVPEASAAKVPDFSKSMAFENEILQKKIDTAAELVKDATAQAEELVTAKENSAKELKALFNKYKATEQPYKDWLKDRQDAEKDYNKALMDEFDAKQDYLAAKAKYDALKAVVDKDVWVYTGQNPNVNDGFVKMDVYQTIDWLEKENTRLEGEIEDARQALSDGKKALAYVNEIIDEAIEVLSERIEIMNAIALKYKAIMNAYLGIVEEGVDAEPVEVEGDEE